MIRFDRVRVSVLAALVAVLALTACGSSGPATTGTSTSAPAESFTFGYSIPTGQNPWINAIADEVRSTAAAGGGEMDLQDSRLDPGKAVRQVGTFITDDVDSITIAPAQVPQALTPLLTKAVKGGIDVFALEWSFAADPTAPPEPPVQGQVNIDRAKLGADVAAAVNAGAPDGARVIYVGLPFPVASLDFFEASLRDHLGPESKVVADLDNPSDNAQGALGPINGALAAHPDANAIVTYNGPSALAGIKAVESAGRTGEVKIYTIQLDTATAAALEAGTIAAAWDLNPPELGSALGDMIVAAASGGPDSEWARTVAVEAPEYTQSTIGSWTDWGKGR